MESVAVADSQRDSVWAFRSLSQMDHRRRAELLKEPPEEYMVPTSAGVVALALDKLGVDPTHGEEGAELWRQLRGRPVARVFAFYDAAKQPAYNDDPNEVARLANAFGRKYPDAWGQS